VIVLLIVIVVVIVIVERPTGWRMRRQAPCGEIRSEGKKIDDDNDHDDDDDGENELMDAMVIK
jgi:hypothetical protein